MKPVITLSSYSVRHWLVFSLFFCIVFILVARAVYLQLLNNQFLQEHGDARSIRTVEVPTHRGVIVDRNGEQLAMSTPVESIWLLPRKVLQHEDRFLELAHAVGMKADRLRSFLRDRIHREFVYLKRHVDPDTASVVRKLAIPGVSTQREYKRYYPSAEITAHIIGFTNIDDQGQEGIELAYDVWLSGHPGKKRVLKDRLNRIVEDIEYIQTATPGKTLTLSIDRRIQYLAYRELAAAVKYHHARSGSLVMLDVHTGEVIAMVGQPSYNPNNRKDLKSAFLRNRAVADIFEPGSTMKPFTIAAGLISGIYQTDSEIETAPGFYQVGEHYVRDMHNYGTLPISTVITKSSNVGASKIALSLPPSLYSGVLSSFGFGQLTGSAFPGESAGIFSSFHTWSDVEIATMSFGYGLSVTLLQLARAYSIIANGGIALPVTFIKQQQPVLGARVIDEHTAFQIREMLESVVSAEGTGKRAKIPGYRVIGKTGTAHKSVRGGYSDDRYVSLFAGIAPASAPRFAMVVLIDEPRDHHFGGVVAAPVFANVMQGTLRILNVPPDNLPDSLMANRHHPKPLKEHVR